MKEWLHNHPTLYFLGFVVAMLLLIWLYRWASSRHKFVPGPDHNPSDHHHWTPIAVAVGIVLIAVMALLGWDKPRTANAVGADIEATTDTATDTNN